MDAARTGYAVNASWMRALRFSGVGRVSVCLKRTFRNLHARMIALCRWVSNPSIVHAPVALRGWPLQHRVSNALPLSSDFRKPLYEVIVIEKLPTEVIHLSMTLSLMATGVARKCSPNIGALVCVASNLFWGQCPTLRYM